MLSTLLWGLGVVLVILQLAKWGRYVFTTVQYALERYTSPEITLAPPPRPDTASATPSLVPLTPAIAGQPDMIQCFDKGTNAPLGTVRVVTKDSLATIMTRARVAQEKWAQTSFGTRRRLLFSLLNYVIKYQREICETSSIECGKTMMDGALGEILTTLEKLRWTAAQGEDVLQEEVRDVGLITAHKRAAVSYLPIGVVGAIVSWNYPFHNIFGPLISALFAGNAFVGKMSEYASFYASYYQDIVRDGLVKLGQSPDLVHFITGFAATGEALVESADKITFIGSPGVGKKVMEKASKTLTPVVLELGGKDPAIVCEDADFDQLIPILMRGTFQNCGQNCVGLERIVAHAQIHDKLVKILEEKVKKLTQGPPSTCLKDMGAMTMGAASVNKIQHLVDETVAAGAKLVYGGKATSQNFFPPTMLINVTRDMPIAQEEVFGPVMVVFKFSNDDEAVDIVNAAPYGLGSSVFTANIPRGQVIAKKLKCGMCNINDFGINYLCQSLPFGGTKASGFDRFAGVEGLRGNCLVRSQTTDRIPGVKTNIPPILQYPITDKSFQFMEHLVQVLYGNTVQFVGAAIKLASFKQREVELYLSPQRRKKGDLATATDQLHLTLHYHLHGALLYVEGSGPYVPVPLEYCATQELVDEFLVQRGTGVEWQRRIGNEAIMMELLEQKEVTYPLARLFFEQSSCLGGSGVLRQFFDAVGGGVSEVDDDATVVQITVVLLGRSTASPLGPCALSTTDMRTPTPPALIRVPLKNFRRWLLSADAERAQNVFTAEADDEEDEIRDQRRWKYPRSATHERLILAQGNHRWLPAPPQCSTSLSELLAGCPADPSVVQARYDRETCAAVERVADLLLMDLDPKGRGDTSAAASAGAGIPPLRRLRFLSPELPPDSFLLVEYTLSAITASIVEPTKAPGSRDCDEDAPPIPVVLWTVPRTTSGVKEEGTGTASDMHDEWDGYLSAEEILKLCQLDQLELVEDSAFTAASN